jgi:predicted site-specific integrase-resolvase
MRLKEWAQKQGVSYKTAWRWFHAGTLPVQAEQHPGGTIIVHEGGNQTTEQVALYARVSGSDQKSDLERQVGRLTADSSQVIAPFQTK